MELKGKKILILGEGISGKGAFSALEGIAIRFFYYEGCLNNAQFDLIVVSPGIPSHPALDYAKINQIPIISEIELGFILNHSPVCAITGTNGKTTVTRLIGDMAVKEHKTIVCGNIGSSFSEAARSVHKLAIVEVSSFQLLNCYSFKPEIAVLTNIASDHLDRHKTIESYISAKLRIAARQTEDDFLICPLSMRPLVTSLKLDHTSRLSMHESATARNINAKIKSSVLYSELDIRSQDGYIYFLNEQVFEEEIIPLKGKHNLSNILQAVGAAKLLGISNESIRQAVMEFKQEPHRIQLVSTLHGKNWFDDSKATNIESCLAACESMIGSSALILGGSDKGQEFDELFLKLPDNITDIFVMGAVMDKLTAAAKRVGRNVICAENLLDAVKLSAKTDATNVLLSPAAASFDNFQNYVQRGKAFLDAVQEI